MKTRIGLMTTQQLGRSKTTFVEVESLAELKAELTKLGAQRLALHWRDRFRDGHTEGEAFTIAELAEKHFEWVKAGDKDATRSLFYDTRA